MKIIPILFLWQMLSLIPFSVLLCQPNPYPQNKTWTQKRIYQLRIVFHAVGTQNFLNKLNEKIIQQFMEELESDFSGQTQKHKSSSIPVSVQKIAAQDTHIRFRLAALMPNGSPFPSQITGLNLHPREQISWTSDQASLLPKLYGWNNQKYVNIYLVENFHPQNLKALSVLSTTEHIGHIVLRPDPNSSHSLSHEMGHYLGLKHPWGKGGSCDPDPDLISDTPSQTSPLFTCEENKIMQCGSRAMVENFMGYAPCRSLFTLKQKNHMQKILSQSLFQDILFPNPSPLGQKSLDGKKENLNDLKKNTSQLPYPNPTSDRVWIPLDYQEGILEDLNGQILMKWSNTEPPLILPQLPPGPYLLHLVKSSRKKRSFQILKK
ncbi:MAG: M43 family zinc metalloprotease [Cytophagales bacterium]|nr:M43 family zinc metalloprotease [Cytophagales bacterium]